jgi:hypothetical protein
MHEMDGKKLCDIAEHLFKKKGPLDSYHQEVAAHFYPERADFTTKNWLGKEFGSDLMSSFPVLMRRDLGNQISMMLRPKTRQWFHLARLGDQEVSHDAKVQLEHMETVMRRAMYDPKAQMTKACRVGDHDFAAFGQCALSVQPNKDYNRLLYRAWHLRDMAWQENQEGEIGFVVRKWKPTKIVAKQVFGDKLHPDLLKNMDKDPFEEVELYHFVVESQFCEYEDPKGRPRFSIWYDKKHKHAIEVVPIYGKHYIIPRWVTINSQYAHSPAVTAALPDARLLQAMTFTLLEVGEKTSNPPLIATKNVVQQTPALYAGGITWVDTDYDERLGEAVRPFPQDYSGIRYGLELNDRTQALIKEAFFLNKLAPFNPSSDPEMTAFQAGQLVQEYVRNALPIFEPMEMEYNAALCEETFALMTRMGGFGSPLDWPQELHGMEVEFQFESPLHDAIDREKGQKWLEAQSLLAGALEMGSPEAKHMIDVKTALRDALDGSGVPVEWTRSDEDIEGMMAAEAQQAQMAQVMEMAQGGAAAAKDFAAAGAQINDMQEPVV